MPELDGFKEEIGWLKVVFALLVAADLSLIGWLAQNFGVAEDSQVGMALLGISIVTIGIVWVNRMAYVRIDKVRTL